MNTRHTQATPENKAAKADEPGGEHEHVFCCRVCGLEPMSAPDRAEELAREITEIYEHPPKWVDKQRTVAALLRTHMGERPDWLTIATMVCLNTDISRDGERVYPGELAKYLSDINEQCKVPLPAPPREEG